VPDLSSVLNGQKAPGAFVFESLPAWLDIKDAFRKNAVPHCWAVKAPLEWHGDILNVMSKLYLGHEGWSRDSHPDMVVVGDFDKPGNIDACRSMIRELSMKPVAAERRLGVLPAADKLLAGAANSLLKIAEEPPPHACLLFLLEGNDLLPTLKSRSRFSVLAAPLLFAPVPAPVGEAQWADRLVSFKDDEDMADVLSSWTSHYLQAGDVASAARTDRLRLLVRQKKLSQTMVRDLLTLTLKEGLPFEPIFGGFW
jgi:DNA polymerase-3 subunit delta'